MKTAMLYKTQKTLIALLVGASSVAMAQGHTSTDPITDSIVVSSSGLQLQAYSFLRADSVIWNVVNSLTNDSQKTIQTGSEVNEPITITHNASVQALVRSQGLWYQQMIEFHGVELDLGSGILQVPVIPNAVYTWYLDDDILPVSGASYTPTANGTYKIVITWPSPINARLAEGANRAEFVIEVTHIVSTALENSTINKTSFTLYPNPAADQLHISNVGGDFEYTIKNAIGNEVARGMGSGNSELNISHLNSGLYMVSIKAGGTETTKKLMVK